MLCGAASQGTSHSMPSPRKPPTALHTSAHQIAFDCKLIAALLHADANADVNRVAIAEVESNAFRAL